MVPEEGDDVTLYFHPFSVRSAMVRFAIALRGDVDPGLTPIAITERAVDIFEMEQLEEWFMLEVNPKGQASSDVLTTTQACHADENAGPCACRTQHSRTAID